jgi:NMD protein affecting ribosome stability and mRNA decay
LITIDIQAKGTIHQTLKPYTETYNTQKAHLIFTVCPSCLSLKRGSYQAVLHILASHREMTEKERDYIFSLVTAESEKAGKLDHLAYISKCTMKKGKITFFIGSERFARALASNLRYNLGGLLKETFKSGSRKIPKEVKLNRLYISLYLNLFIEGDLLWVKDSPLYVLHIQGDAVKSINLLTQQEVKTPSKNLKNANILRHPTDLRTFMYFSQTKEIIQLMDIKNYQIYEISKSPVHCDLEVGKYINGFEVNGQLFLVSKSNE